MLPGEIMGAPLGRAIFEKDLKLFRLMSVYNFIKWGDKPIQLNCGIATHVYVGGRHQNGER